jgi:hypothetical protein
LRRWVGDWFEVCVTVVALALGIIAGFVAMSTAAEKIEVSFYDTIAQILPVFLVALAVEQRLIDRLGISEEEYVKGADRALSLGAGAEQADMVEEYVAAQELQASFDSQPQFGWVRAYIDEFVHGDDPRRRAEITEEARRRYRRARGNEAVFVAVAVAALIIGEAAALGGMLQGGTTRCSVYLGLTTASTVSVVVALTLSGGRELVSSLRR